MKIARKSWVLIVATALCAGAATAAVFHGSPFSNMVENAVETPVAAIRQVFIPDPAQVFGKDSIRVLLVGLDYDYDAKDQETSKSSRSDIIMAINLDFKNHRVSELSIPRDMVATLPNGETAKINQAQSDGGIKESSKVVADWLGITPFDRYVVMRIDTSKDLINALGGIDVFVKNSDALQHAGANGPIDYDDNWGHLHIHLKPGLQHLGGDNAVAYARFRHDWCSDPCRIMRQQQVIRAIIDKINHDRLNTLTHAQQLLAVVHNDIDTNFTTQEEIASAMSFSHVTQKDIRTAQVPYVSSTMLPDYGDSLIPDEQAKQRLVASLLAPPADDVAVDAGRPASTVRLHIENGTNAPGLAARIAVDLRRQGFTVSDVGDAPDHDRAVTEIHSNSNTSGTLYRVRTALGPAAENARLLSDIATQGQAHEDVTIVLGRDIANAGP